MKSEYLKNLIIYKDHSRNAYESYLQRIQELFPKVQQNPSVTNFAKFETQVHAIKYHRQLKAKHKQPIFKYFVQRNIDDFHFLREHNSIQLRLLKATKTQLDDYQLDWKAVWERLLEQQPELPSVKTYNELTQFLRIIRHLYTPENAVDVINYFMERHSLYTDNLSSYLTLFIHIGPKTSSAIFTAYLDKLFELYNLNQLKASELLVMYLNAAKYKQHQISPKVHQELNKIVLYSLSTPSSDKKDSIESKFSTQTSNIAFRIIGKCNQCSVELIEQIFKMLKLFIRPFEDSKKPLKFLCLFIMGFSKRIDTEQRYREKIVKLQAKLEKAQKKSKKEQPLSPESPQVIPTVEQPETALEKPITEKEIDKQEQNIEESQDDESEQNESDEEDQDNKVEKLITMQLELEEHVPEKETSLQNRIEKLQLLLKNQITEEIKKVVEVFIVKHLEEIFYVNSKKMVSRILKQTFKLYPQTVTKSLDILEKAGNIPTINQDGLISNIKFIAKYLFSEHLIENGVFLEHILKLLGRVKESRRITDVWDILNAFILKLPLLDEKDMENISDSEKEQFEKKFNQNHDRFYETYSDDIFDCVKRLFSQSQYYDQNTSHSIDKHILDLLTNSHPYYKKRVLHEMQQQILENNNKFLLSIYHPGLRPSKSFQTTLHEMVQNGNIDNEENMSLSISVNTILSIDMDIQQIKKLIRKYSKKNNYKFLKQIMVSLTNYIITFQPLSSSLNYLYNKPEIKMKQEPSHQLVQNKILHVYEYSMEILEQLAEELKEFQEQPLRKMSYQQVVDLIYNKKDGDFKNLKVQKRKTINQLLEILKIIAEHLFHQFQQFNPKTSTLDFKPAPYNRQSLLTSDTFIKIVHILTYNQLFLHDPNIMLNLTNLIENQIYFMYRHYIRLEKQIMRKYSKKNQRQELPGQSNVLYVANMEIGKSRIAHFSVLYNKYKDSVSIDPIREPLNVLLIAPGNQRSNSINKIIVKKSEQIEKEADRLIFLLGRNFNSRFYYEKIFSLFSDFLTSGYKFSAKQIVSIINFHLPLFQSDNIKIKDHSFKSLDRFFKTMRKNDLFGEVEYQLRQFTKREKLELIWMIAVIIISKEGRRETQVEEYLSQLFDYLKELQKLVLSEVRIVRRIALFAYSFIMRRARQALKQFERIQCDSVKYPNPKSIRQIYESGFLRQEHIDNKQVANYQMLKKTAPYSSYRQKKYAHSDTYTKIKEHAFNFILSNPELGLKVLQQFHIDMAASVQQVISMMHNKKHDLSQIAVRNLEGCYVYAKLNKLHFDRFEHHFGSSFFKFMLYKDAEKNEMNFFKATKGEVEKLLNNLQGYDNQTLVFIYLGDVLAAYEQYHQHFSQELRLQLQSFVIKFVTQMIYKGSGAIFKQLMVLLSHCKQKKALTFLQAFLENLINNKEKVSRASQLLFTLCEDDFEVYSQTVKLILSERMEINNAYINTLLNTVITLPEKYMLTSAQIQKYGIIDLEKEKTAQHLQQLYHHEIYLPSNREIDQFVVANIEKYVEIITKEPNGEEEIKERNELIKATYGITNNLISTFCQFYETPESVRTILKLLELLFKFLACKMDLPIDYKTLEDTIKTLLSNKHDHISNFQESLDLILKHLSSLPVKKQADIIKIVANRPGNFHFVSQEYYENFIFRTLALEEHSMIYKELMISLSTLLAYVPLPLSIIEKIADKVTKGQGILLLQAYVMSTEDIGSPFVNRILNSATSQRRNLFCKEMLQLRGKKEYLDDGQRYIQWREIKQYSNPYHYHV